jgi:hypothetical protein
MKWNTLNTIQAKELEESVTRANPVLINTRSLHAVPETVIFLPFAHFIIQNQRLAATAASHAMERLGTKRHRNAWIRLTILNLDDSTSSCFDHSFRV